MTTAQPTTTFTFFVYAICYPNGVPFYIGYGQEHNIRFSEIQVRNGTLDSIQSRHEIIRDIIESGGELRYEIMCETHDREFAASKRDEYKKYFLPSAFIGTAGRLTKKDKEPDVFKAQVTAETHYELQSALFAVCSFEGVPVLKAEKIKQIIYLVGTTLTPKRIFRVQAHVKHTYGTARVPVEHFVRLYIETIQNVIEEYEKKEVTPSHIVRYFDRQKENR